ncbi:MAG: ribonuclease domain-containing protein [Elusimicrobiota bacterium]
MRRLAVSVLLFAALLSPARAQDWSLRLSQGYSANLKAIQKAEIGIWAIEPGTDLSPQFSDPNRVRTILKLIEDVYYGRPLQYPKDGTVFQNREGLLPPQQSGYYREYTVMPPAGSPSRISVGGQVFDISPANGTRGAERVIIGGGREAWYSPNHYKNFIQLTVLR